MEYCFYVQCMHGPNCKLGNFCTVGRRIQEVNVLGGLILPVWGAVEKALSKQVTLHVFCSLVFLVICLFCITEVLPKTLCFPIQVHS